ncbi:MAG: hypothetical protein K1Y02_03375 [Candidatus Hydrogenedentes bacterium]|nr:hypothetical protein [Candidatus Hydrogenedentota bacterium]
MIRISMTCLRRLAIVSIGVAAIQAGAVAQQAADPDAAYVAKFLEKYKEVTPQPDIATYAAVKRYDELYMGDELRKTIETQSNNDQSALAWGLCYRMRSLNTMYRATHDPKYLRANLDAARAVVAMRDDKRGKKLWTGEVAKAWGCDLYATERGRAVFTVHTGMIAHVILDCLVLTRDCREVREELGAEFGQMLSAVEEAIAFHDSEWRDGPEKGEGHYISLNQEPPCDNKPQPGNRQSAMGCALWSAWKLTHNPLYRDRAKALARYMQRRFTPSPDGAYYWSYWLPELPVTEPAPKESISGEDSSHGSLTLLFPMVLAEDRVVFKKKTMKGFANTVLKGLGRREDGIFFGDVTGNPSSSPDYVASPAFWLPLSRYDQEVRKRVETFYLKYVATPPPCDLADLVLYCAK